MRFFLQKQLRTVSLALLCTPTALLAQRPDPATVAAFSRARSLYYTPVDAGLQSFHCEVGFDWKAFMVKASNAPVLDDDVRLKYLKTIQLTVDDDLHGSGKLHWDAPTPPPEGAEDSISHIREPFQQLWSGFFQAWNGFLTGDMVTLDSKATVEHSETGYKVHVQTGPGAAAEQYDDKLLLQSIHVTTPTLDSLVEPSFSSTPSGLIVTSIRSVYRQPPGTDSTEVLMKVNYAPVGSFQLPSELTITVGPASFEFHLANCTVRTQITPK